MLLLSRIVIIPMEWRSSSTCGTFQNFPTMYHLSTLVVEILKKELNNNSKLRNRTFLVFPLPVVFYFAPVGEIQDDDDDFFVSQNATPSQADKE